MAISFSQPLVGSLPNGSFFNFLCYNLIMNQYVFILGRNPELSAAEIKAVLPQAKVILENDSFLVLEIGDEVPGQARDDKGGCQVLLNRLGGTIKIGKIIGQEITADIIAGEIQQMGSRITRLTEQRQSFGRESGTTGKKINFGLSYYDCPKDDLGMAVKKELKQAGISSRLVTSREKTLSSVVVTKNKCQEFLVLGFISPSLFDKLRVTLSLSNVSSQPSPTRGEGGLSNGRNRWLAKTCAVQEFEDYSARDYGRPIRDLVSGSLPPKLAQIMINLAQASQSAVILDPFCGSGTILQEAILMGYKNVVGSDKSDKAVEDTKKNLEWLGKKFEIRNSKFEVLQSEVGQISSKVKKVDAIVTEPYLGPALRGGESREQIEKTVSELESLYLTAFAEFAKVLSPSGRIVIIFPWFKQFNLTLNIFTQIKKLGFSQLDQNGLVYGRPDQRVFRRIHIFSR